ncbi:MAG: prepilin-type N-terminal cleavage/methylation domain-containing protein [Kiritimatiellaeota bacterium]|nr:prepilin-type N-terminal cleavage/methylation domain-containing protein [Kiritimatiellota bacterium]
MTNLLKSGRAGFTLLETLVALLIMAILFPMVAEVCRSSGRSIRDTSNRAALVRELGLATSTLALDLGRATRLAVSAGELHLSAWASPKDASVHDIVYARDTESRQLGAKNIVAIGLELFRAVQMDANTVRLELSFRKGEQQRQLVLIGSVL